MPWIQKLLIGALVSVCAVLASSAWAQPSTPVSHAWRTLTLADVDALYQSVRAIHPGYRDPETPDFAGRVEAAYRSAQERAAKARTYLDWREATQGFMLSFRDGHTIFRLNAVPARVRWPGFLIEGRGGDYVIRTPAGLSDVDAEAPQGARVISCDGIPIELLLKNRLDGREADWSKAPERIRQAYRLLIHYQTDGPEPVTTCRVADGGREIDLKLKWRVEIWSELAPALAPFHREIVRPVAARTLSDGAYWIGLGSFGDESALTALAAKLEAQSAKLRAAPYIVLDLRGNRGGNSVWGATFAHLIWGEPAFNSKLVQPSASAPFRGGKFWRASTATAAEARRSAERFAAMGPAMAGPAQYFKDVATLIEKAPNGDRALVEDPCCKPDAAPTAPALVARAYTRPVYLLTDAACFSSCVLALVPLRAMGAVVVGETTGQNEEYGEIAGPIVTPSGLARYFVPMTIIRQPRETLVVGPDRAWSGAMDDDAGIEAWIAAMQRAGSG